MKGQMATIGGLIGLLVIVLIGVTAVIPTIQQTLTDVTTATTVISESHSPANGDHKNYTFILNNIDQGIASIEGVGNTSLAGGITFYLTDDCNAAIYGAGTRGNYTFNEDTANMTICNYNGTKAVYVNYTYYQDNYISGANRTILSNIPFLVGVAVLLFVIMLIFIRAR